MKHRRPTAQELDLWRNATRDVKRRQPLEETAPAVSAPVIIPAPSGTEAIMPPTPRRPVSPNVFDANIERRILKGQARIEARLDLHGMTQAAAHAALCGFIVRCAASGHRLVLVVTGKGAMGEGALKQNVPRWLESPPLAALVSSSRPAYDRHGGAGAAYVLLRKHRSIA